MHFFKTDNRFYYFLKKIRATLIKLILCLKFEADSNFRILQIKHTTLKFKLLKIEPISFVKLHKSKFTDPQFMDQLRLRLHLNDKHHSMFCVDVCSGQNTEIHKNFVLCG